MLLSNIQDFQVCGDYLYYYTSTGQVYSSFLQSDIHGQLLDVKGALGITNNRGKLFLYTEGDTCILNKNNVTDVYHQFVITVEDEKYYARVNSDGVKQLACFRNDISKEKLWSLNFYSTIFLFGSKLYVVKFTDTLQRLNLLCINKLTGLAVWQYAVPEKYAYQYPLADKRLAEVSRIIGEYKGILWVSLESGRLIGLDIETGVEVRNIHLPNSYPNTLELPESDGYFHFGKYSTFDKIEGKLFGMAFSYYYEIDLNKIDHNYIVYDIKETLLKRGFHYIDMGGLGYELSFQNEFVLFGYQQSGTEPSSVGIFNRLTKEVVWSSVKNMTEQPYFKGLRKLIIKNNRIYVLDAEAALHIIDIDFLS
jgi:hypothetical protein